MGRMITARQYARDHRVHHNTVYAWIASGLIPHQTRKAPNGSPRYYIDEDTPPPETTRGRPEKDDSLQAQLMLARIINLSARTKLIIDRIERERAEADQPAEGVEVRLEPDIEDWGG